MVQNAHNVSTKSQKRNMPQVEMREAKAKRKCSRAGPYLHHRSGARLVGSAKATACLKLVSALMLAAVVAVLAARIV